MDKPIRILHVIGRMDRGGAETMIMNLYRHIDRTQIQFDFVENTPNHMSFDDEILSLGGRIYRCPHYSAVNHFSYCLWWKRFFDEHGSEYSIVHGHLGSTAAIYLSYAKRHGIYTIAHSHNTNGTGLRDRIYQVYAYPTRMIADFFFACSVDAGIDRFGKKTVNRPGAFHVLNNAIDTSRFQYDEQAREKIRARFGLDDSVVFGHVGRFFAQKNHEFLIDIFASIAKQCGNAKLLLIGGGELEEQIVRKVEKLGLRDQVVFAGTQEDTAPFYQAMDVFLFPSLYEGFGMVAVEAQASGLPCIISDKVSRECILTDDLVYVCSLEDSAENWASCALEHSSYSRSDHSLQIRDRGYGAEETSKWLEQFYLERSTKR